MCCPRRVPPNNGYFCHSFKLWWMLEKYQVERVHNLKQHYCWQPIGGMCCAKFHVWYYSPILVKGPKVLGEGIWANHDELIGPMVASWGEIENICSEIIRRALYPWRSSSVACALQDCGTQVKFGIITIKMWKNKPFPMLKGKAIGGTKKSLNTQKDACALSGSFQKVSWWNQCYKLITQLLGSHHGSFFWLLEANEIKHLITIVWRIAGDLLDETDPYDKLVMGALAGSVSMEEILDQSKGQWSLSPSQAATFCKGCETLNLSLTQLGLITHAKQVALWHYTIKNHILEHIAMGAMEFSPSLSWNYGSESLLMHLRTLVLGNRTQPNVWALQGVVMKSWFAGWELGLNPKRLKWE